MIPHLVYKNIHLVGIFMVILALGGVLEGFLFGVEPQSPTVLGLVAGVDYSQDYYLGRLGSSHHRGFSQPHPGQASLVDYYCSRGSCGLYGWQQAFLIFQKLTLAGRCAWIKAALRPCSAR